MSIHEGHRQRLKDRFRREGLDNFDELYVLELLLFYCIPRVDTNPIAHRLLDYFGSLNNVLNATAEELEKVEGIADASSSREVFQRLVQIRRVVDIVSATLVAMLGAVSVFIIANTVKLAMFARRDEIGIMKMVGATNRFIRAPFVVEGMLLGMCAAGLAFLAQWGVYEYIAQQLSAGTGVLTLLPFEEFRYGLALLLVGAGLVFGIGGSTITIRKFMKV